jgi:AraC-like DNA-binding protein
MGGFMLRSIAIQRYVRVVEGLHGVPASTLLKGSDIEARHLAMPDHLIQPGQLRAVIGNLLARTGDEGIGLDVWRGASLAAFGIIGHAALTCRTLQESYPIWRRYGKVLVGLGYQVNCFDDDDAMTFAFAAEDSLDPLHRFFVEELLGIFMIMGEHLSEPPRIRRAAFAYPEPRYAERYRALFGCPLEFGAVRRTQITVSKTWLHRPMPTHDQEFNEVCRRHCDQVWHRISHFGPTASRLHEYLEASAAGIPPPLDVVARALGLSARTLRRRLSEEGTSFRAEVDAYRLDQARMQLSRADVSPKEAAYRLGFAEPSAFRHAFKEWTGITVGEFRRRALGTSVPLQED